MWIVITWRKDSPTFVCGDDARYDSLARAKAHVEGVFRSSGVVVAIEQRSEAVIDRTVGPFSTDDDCHKWARDLPAGKEFTVVEVEPLNDGENLDAMNNDELLDAVKNHQLLASYAMLKLGAQEAREAGEISRALMIEKTCDAIYSEIPSEARW